MSSSYNYNIVEKLCRYHDKEKCPEKLVKYYKVSIIKHVNLLVTVRYLNSIVDLSLYIILRLQFKMLIQFLSPHYPYRKELESAIYGIGSTPSNFPHRRHTKLITLQVPSTYLHTVTTAVTYLLSLINMQIDKYP